MSGGLTTDICFYQTRNGEFEGSYFHRISYGSANRVTSSGRMIVANNRDSFEIWSMGINIERTELLVRY